MQQQKINKSIMYQSMAINYVYLRISRPDWRSIISILLAPSPGIYRVAGIVRSLDWLELNISGDKLEHKTQL